MHRYFPLLSQFCTCAARLCDIKALEAGARRVQEKYANESLMPLEGVAEHVAYIQCRMPATFAAVLQALRHLALVIPDFSPRSMIDLGSGPGTATLGAMVTFPTIADSVGYERSEEFCRLSEQLASLVPQIVRSFHAIPSDLERLQLPKRSFDFLISSYAMGELSESAQQQWCAFAKDHAPVVLFVEPGTPAGWQCLMRCREMLLSMGAVLLAPCPHACRCPCTGTDVWCHEAVRLPRTSLHRRLKGGSLGYEDEKFCYLAATFDSNLPRNVPPCRIVHAPRHRHGHTHLVLCTSQGVLEPTIISRKYGELYRLARQATWGDSLPRMKEDVTI
jgi:ribosomal protein RSM22 (predicted rRNA methylase)